jgi:hypothetical protein
MQATHWRENVILTDEGGKDLDSGCGNEILPFSQDDIFRQQIVRTPANSSSEEC